MIKKEYDVVTIVGNRPQFIKMASVSKEISTRGYSEFIIHSGQHYDQEMSDVFFEELNIPKPNLRLESNHRSHGRMTGYFLEKLESVFEEIKPKFILIYGDTNTTLAAALAAVKLKIKIAHIEAGPRIYDIESPEEINRIVADHASQLRFCPDIISVQNLAKENIVSGVYFSGDVMLDAFNNFSKKAESESSILERVNLDTKKFVFLTTHRPSNTDSKEALLKIIDLIKCVNFDVLFSVHPRTENCLKTHGLWGNLKDIKNLTITKSLGYLDTLKVLSRCEYVITDSGGLQKEAYFARKPCFVFLNTTPWPQIHKSNWLKLLGNADVMDVSLAKSEFLNFNTPKYHPDFFGTGSSSRFIIDCLESEGWI